MKFTYRSAVVPRWRWAWVMALFAGVFALPLLANPAGGSVAAGAAAIAGQGTGKVMVTQSSNLAIINWQSFSINAGESTSFLQPSGGSAVLNRVLGGQTSLINGTLSGNGQIYLINGNGIVVGPGGVVHADAFTASTRELSDANFLSRNLHFVGNNLAGVQNLGTITALGGNAVLIGKSVDNGGTIKAPNGTAGLIAGDDVLLAQKNTDGSTITVHPNLSASPVSGRVAVNNHGAINAAVAELKAANGNVYALAIQNTGIIRATTVKKQGGRIWLTSDSGTVVNSGTLDASATASGGSGGTVTLRSTRGAVCHAGQILAEGGAGGTGGNAEISGAQFQYTGLVDLTAPSGRTGDLLLDPDTLEIIASGGTGTIGGLPPTGDSLINASSVVNALNGANLTLQANTSISVNAAVISSANGRGGNLVLNAPTLNLNAGIALYSGSTLSGNATTVNVGASGSVQNGIDASSTTTAPTINLAAGATYNLTTEVLIAKSLNLDGTGAILNGQSTVRVMEIDGSTLGNTVNLSNLTLENGNAVSVNSSGYGGALILLSGGGNHATVTITNSAIIDSSTTGSGLGGGIFNEGNNTGSDTLRINNCTIAGNTAAGVGGGIYNDGNNNGNATLTITDSTIAGNSTFRLGGAIYNDGDNRGIATLTISNSTIAGNSAALAGGIYNDGQATGSAKLTMGNTIWAGNTAGGTESDYADGADGGETIISNGYNIYGQNRNDGGLNNNNGEFPGGYGPGDTLLNGSVATVLQTNGSGSPLLADNGGPTETVALVAGSPAIDAGDPHQIGALDQRGIVRGSSADYTGSATDIGAYEAQVIAVTADSVTTTYGTAPSLIYSVTSGPTGASTLLSGSLALITLATNTGTYPSDIGQGTLALTTGSYVLDFTAGTLQIDPKAITLMSNASQGKVYGMSDPLSTATAYSLASGSTLVGGDILTGNMGRAAGENEGSYPFTPNTVMVNDGNGGRNYMITFDGTTNEFQIFPANLTASIANQSIVYGASDPSPSSIAVTLGGIVNTSVSTLNGTVFINDTGKVATTLNSLARNPGENVGSYNYTSATFNGLTGSAAGNYSLPTLAGIPTLTITPAPLTVAVNAGGNSTYGSTPVNPGISLTSGTLYNGDTLSSIGLGDDFNLTLSSPVGAYIINVTGGNNPVNYTVTPLSATYNVNPAGQITPVPPGNLIPAKADALVVSVLASAANPPMPMVPVPYLAASAPYADGSSDSSRITLAVNDGPQDPLTYIAFGSSMSVAPVPFLQLTAASRSAVLDNGGVVTGPLPPLVLGEFGLIFSSHTQAQLYHAAFGIK